MNATENAAMDEMRKAHGIGIGSKNIFVEFFRMTARRWSFLPTPYRYLLLLLAASVPAYIVSPSFPLFRPGDDYAVYTYFGEAVSQGNNPYAIPPGYRSKILPRLFDVGSTQTTPGVVRQQYADYPPLLMIINSYAIRLHPFKGLYVFYLILYGLTVALGFLYVMRNRPEDFSTESTFLCFIIFFTLNPLITWSWFQPVGDKIWFALFMMLILLVRTRPYWLAVVLGLFAAVKGLGIPVLFFYLLSMAAHRSLRGRQYVTLVLIFLVTLGASHVFWFPEWIRSYEWRAGRQAFVGHDSFFVPFAAVGMYSGMLPYVLTILGFLLLGVCTIKKYLTLPEVLLLPIVFSIIFNADLSVDRLLVAILCMLLLTKHSGVIVISYAIGVFLIRTNHANPYAWMIMWGWVAYLVFVFGRQTAKRTAAAMHVPASSAETCAVQES